MRTIPNWIQNGQQHLARTRYTDIKRVDLVMRVSRDFMSQQCLSARTFSWSVFSLYKLNTLRVVNHLEEKEMWVWCATAKDRNRTSNSYKPQLWMVCNIYTGPSLNIISWSYSTKSHTIFIVEKNLSGLLCVHLTMAMPAWIDCVNCKMS